MGRALRHSSDEGSHDQNSIEREGRDTEKDRERDRERYTCSIHIEGRREGGTEQNMQVHTPTCSSKSPTQF